MSIVSCVFYDRFIDVMENEMGRCYNVCKAV